MGNNNEIRKRMETCRMVLLAVVWIAGITGMIGGIIMINESSYLKPFGIAIIIVSILGSIIGHFLVNVILAIPFILLNNGDNLAAVAGTPLEKMSSGGSSNIKGVNEKEHPNETELAKIVNNLPLSKGDMLIALDAFELLDSTAINAVAITNVYKGNYLKYISTVESRYFIETLDGKQGYCFPNKVNKKSDNT